MNTSKMFFHLSCVVAILGLFESCGTTQNEQIRVLEKRIDILEQKIKLLEQKAPISRFDNIRELAPLRAAMMRDINVISSSARSYSARNRTYPPGTGSYLGFTIPVSLHTSPSVNYSTSPSDTDMVIEGSPTGVDGKISARINRFGFLVDWTFTGVFRNFNYPNLQLVRKPPQDFEGMRDDISKLVEDAKGFRKNSRGKRGVASYREYSVPDSQSATPSGWYAAIPYDRGIIIEGHSKRLGYIRRATIDDEGDLVRIDSIMYAGAERVRNGKAGSAIDTLRENISTDFRNIASRAREYRSRPRSSGGGGGTYTGYLSAQVSSVDGMVQYFLAVDSDLILLKAISVRGLGTISAKLNAGGIFFDWYYSGKLAE